MRFITVLLLAAALCSSCSPSAEDLQKDPHGDLIWAARHGDVATVRNLAARGVDLDASSTVSLKFVFPDFDHRGRTALQHAVVKDQVNAVRVLLLCGADPDAQQAGATPLFIAATKKDLTMFRLLLEAGADVNVTKAWTQTPAAKNDGDLWPVVENALARAYGGQPPKGATQRTPPTDGRCRE
jgi:ankyrin repeat protein